MRKGIGKEKKQATAALKSEGNGFYAPNGSFLQRKSSRSGEWVDSLAEMEAPVHRFSPLQLKLAGA
ncbi:MAG TPA: hypothetical protein ENJ82_13720, partial [Bacteroidetes bacterium]|nr:hypothetical protein [Bacteroidota bacterium]